MPIVMPDLPTYREYQELFANSSGKFESLAKPLADAINDYEELKFLVGKRDTPDIREINEKFEWNEEVTKVTEDNLDEVFKDTILPLAFNNLDEAIKEAKENLELHSKEKDYTKRLEWFVGFEKKLQEQREKGFSIAAVKPKEAKKEEKLSDLSESGALANLDKKKLSERKTWITKQTAEENKNDNQKKIYDELFALADMLDIDNKHFKDFQKGASWKEPLVTSTSKIKSKLKTLKEESDDYDKETFLKDEMGLYLNKLNNDLEGIQKKITATSHKNPSLAELEKIDVLQTQVGEMRSKIVAIKNLKNKQNILNVKLKLVTDNYDNATKERRRAERYYNSLNPPKPPSEPSRLIEL